MVLIKKATGPCAGRNRRSGTGCRPSSGEGDGWTGADQRTPPHQGVRSPRPSGRVCMVHTGRPAAGMDPLAFLAGGGEMGERIRAFDWSKTPLGPAESWSPAMRTVVRMMLANRLPMLLWWGPQYLSIYNDPYIPVLGNKHPWALGQPVSECWKEIWHVLRPLIDTPFHGGPATWDEDILLVINRHGLAEETHWLIAYSPVPDDGVAGGIGGALATVHETTEKVVGQRRMVALRDLATHPAEAKTADEACAVAARTL